MTLPLHWSAEQVKRVRECFHAPYVLDVQFQTYAGLELGIMREQKIGRKEYNLLNGNVKSNLCRSDLNSRRDTSSGFHKFLTTELGV